MWYSFKEQRLKRNKLTINVLSLKLRDSSRTNFKRASEAQAESSNIFSWIFYYNFQEELINTVGMLDSIGFKIECQFWIKC